MIVLTSKKPFVILHLTRIEQNESFVVQEKYLNELSVSIGVSDEAVKKDFLNYKNKKGQPQIKPKEPSTPDKKKLEGGPVRLTNVEDDLLFSILHDDRIAGPIANIIEPNLAQSPYDFG